MMSQTSHNHSGNIDVNTATIEQLESLIGIGHAKAETIIEIRKVISHT